MLKEILTQKGLSHREAEVAELVSKGLSNKEVAGQLFVTEKTVKFHLTNIYKKMAVKSRAQLIVWCVPHVDFVNGSTAQAQGNQGIGPAQSAATIAAPSPISNYNSGIIASSNNNSGNTGSNNI